MQYNNAFQNDNKLRQLDFIIKKSNFLHSNMIIIKSKSNVRQQIKRIDKKLDKNVQYMLT